jgi:hypothetical protein
MYVYRETLIYEGRILIKRAFSALLAVLLIFTAPVFGPANYITVAEAGLVSSGVKALALSMFGKVLLQRGGQVLRNELLQMIRRDPKILDDLVVKGAKWVAKNPRLRGNFDDFVAEARAVSKYDKVVKIPRSKYPEAAKHMDDAVDAGHPRAVEIFRPGAKQNRRDSLRGTKRQSGYDRDEYPPAMSREGGTGSSVRPINPSDNRGAGSCVGWQCVDLPDGSRILLDTVD